MARETLFLVDGRGYIYRAFYAIRQLSNRQGVPTNAVFGFAEEVEAALQEQVQREGETSEAIGENAVANVAAGGVVTREGRRLLPGFAAASSVLVVGVGKGLMCRDPKTLQKKKCKKHGSNALRQVEVEAANTRESVGHQEQRADSTSLNVAGAFEFIRMLRPIPACSDCCAGHTKAASRAAFDTDQ